MIFSRELGETVENVLCATLLVLFLLIQCD